MDRDKTIEQYYEEINQCNFWILSKKSMDCVIALYGLVKALEEKSIISNKEWNNGIQSAKEEYSSQINELQKNMQSHLKRKDELEKEIILMKKEEEEHMKILKNIFGSDI